MDSSTEITTITTRVLRIFRNLGKKIYVGDTSLWIIIFGLLTVSCVAIYTSTISQAVAEDKSHIYFLIHHLFHVGLGFLTLIITKIIPIKLYKKFASVIFIFMVLLMLYVMFFAPPINGARRWINLFGFDIQVSDYFKIALAIMLTKVTWVRRERLSSLVLLPLQKLVNYKKENNLDQALTILRQDALPMLFPAALGVMLIMPENLSTSLIVGIISLTIYFNLGVSIKEIGKMIFVAIILVAMLISVMAITGSGRVDTWQSRVEQFFVDDEAIFDNSGNLKYGYQLSNDTNQRLQSDIAIANGWLLGVGAGNSVQRSELPLPYADFIYSIIIEEWGLAGALIVFMFYAWFFRVTARIANRCEDSFASMLAISLGTLFTLSAVCHIFVCIGIFPITGLTLPMISKGGSSILYAFLVFGIISKISYEQQQRERKRLEQLQSDTTN